MNNLGARTGQVLYTLTLCALLAACNSDTAEQGAQLDRLPPCSADGSIFAEKPFEEWKELYHSNVSKVVEAHLKSIQDTVNKPLQCTAASYSELVPATDELKEVAGYLAGYRQGNRLSQVTETDIGPVLLEFVRVYECSMRERGRNLAVIIPEEKVDPLEYGQLYNLSKEDEKKIEEEIAIARPALERTLTMIGGYDRLRPLTLDIECIKRTSLDLRNVLGLASDASSCLPRVWDTHGSLRDLP